MGHSDPVHNHFYELPQDILHLAKASKVLYAIENGIHKYKGKTLDEIGIDVEEDLTEDSGIDMEDELNCEGDEDKKDELNREGDEDKKNVRDEEEEDTDIEEMDDVSSSSSEDETPAKKKRRVKPKKKSNDQHTWTEEQKEAARKFFQRELITLEWPKQQRCSKYLETHMDLGLTNCTWKKVKDYISWLVKSKKKNPGGQKKGEETLRKNKSANHTFFDCAFYFYAC